MLFSATILLLASAFVFVMLPVYTQKPETFIIKKGREQDASSVVQKHI